MRAVSAVLAAVAMLATGCAGSAAAPSPPRPPRIYVDGVRVAKLRPHYVLTHGLARIDVAVRVPLARRAVRRAFMAGSARADVPFRAVSSSIAIRPVRQVLPDDCEATSLSMLLTAAGIHVGQLKLQSELPISGPLDPQPVPGSKLFRWGDPEKGFVGRVRGNGSGESGGFGVYEPPIRHLAARYGVHLVDLHGKSIATVRAALLAGHPVLAWIGRTDGPYEKWLTPSGHVITINTGEHAVVLVGAGPGYFLVDNPLTGRERWSESLFSYRWPLLGDRALELP